MARKRYNMKILQLCNKFPYPLKDGAAIASTCLARALVSLGHEVSLLSMNTSKHWFDLEKLPSGFNHYRNIYTVYIDNRVKPADALLNLISGESYHVSRFVSERFRSELKKVLESKDYDAVILETVFTAPYIKTVREISPRTLVILRAHNVEHEIWERVARNSGLLKKWYLNLQAGRLKKFEISAGNACDILGTVTSRDADTFRLLGTGHKIISIPIGIDVRDYTENVESFSKPVSMAFIGSLDWMPNEEGLRWFLDNIWKKRLHLLFPDLTFHIAGRNAPSWLKHLDTAGVIFHGEVPDAREFLLQHSISVVPLLSGGGMRVKILEAMALGRMVISTTIGMEGINPQHGVHCLIADEPGNWEEAVSGCLNGQYNPEAIGIAARSFCAVQFDNLRIAGDLVDSIEQYPRISDL